MPSLLNWFRRWRGNGTTKLPAPAVAGPRTELLTMSAPAWKTLDSIARRERTSPGEVVAALLELDEVVMKSAPAKTANAK